MTNCPVCDTPFRHNICAKCGFDHSRNYEAFPTFSPVPAADAVSRLRGARENVIRCDKCGGGSFSLQAGTMLPVCRRCGTVFTAPQTSSKASESPKQSKQSEPPKQSAAPEKASSPFKKLFAQKTRQSTGGGDEITAIAGGFDHTAVLRSDGHVRAVGSNEFGQCNTTDWENITAIAAARGITLGLKKDGTVLAVGDDRNSRCHARTWQNVRAIAASPTMAAAIHEDGSISLAGETAPLASMPKIRNPGGTLALGHRHLVLLSPKGTVAAFGDNTEGQCNVSKWTDIAAIAAGEAHTVGLKRDGTVVATGRNTDGQCRAVTFLAPWKNIRAIAAGDSHTVALRKDGTVLCCGSNSFSKCDTRTWTNVRLITAGALTTLALTKDAKILAAGWQTEDLPASLMQAP